MSSEKNSPGVLGKEKSKAAQIGPVSVSLLIHLAFMMVIGGVVIIEQVMPKTSFKAAVLGESFDQQTTEETVPDETLPDPGAAANPELPMDSVEPQASASENTMDVMAVNSPVASSSWMVTSSPAVGAVGKVGTSGGGGTGTSGTGKGPRMKNPFGDLTRTAGALQGSFYDLKQTPDRKPSGMDATKYWDVLKEFERKGWNPKVFEAFYKAAQPVYATQFFIPLQSAGTAPKAFNVEKEVQPAQWVILYEGTFAVPASDRYRFVGLADDVLKVRLNGEEVLDGNLTAENRYPGKDPAKAHRAGNGTLVYGKWINMDQGTSQKIQVLLGERPGGQFCAFLLIEAQSATYKKEPNGRSILPLFQLAETDLKFDADISKGLAPAYSSEPLLMIGEK